MSSILKALKKLEDEKTTRKPETLRIDADILRGDTSSHFSPLKISLMAVLLFVCGSSTTYVYMKRHPESPIAANNTSTVTFKTTAIPSSSVVPDVRITPDPIAPAATLTQTNANRVAPQSTGSSQVSRQQPKSIQAPVIVQSQKSLTKYQLIQPVKVPIEGKHKSSAISKEKAALVTTIQMPIIKVDGIAFQDGVDSVAMINGIPVSKGSVIDGAKVENIQKDRVLFSYGAERFEVSLGKSNH